jgi:hypothetical protein
MLVADAHRELSLSLGDSVIIASPPASNTVIPDGVRYTKTIRDSYLNRAMLTIYSKVLKQVAPLPRQIGSDIIGKMFPTGIKFAIVNTDRVIDTSTLFPPGGTFTELPPIYILSIYAYDNGNVDADGNMIPVPIKDAHRTAALSNARNVQKPDLYCTIDRNVVGGSTNIHLYGDFTDYFTLGIRWLSSPINPSTQTADQSLDIDEHFIPEVLTLATVYGYQDSQELPDIQQFLGMQLQQSGG